MAAMRLRCGRAALPALWPQPPVLSPALRDPLAVAAFAVCVPRPRPFSTTPARASPKPGAYLRLQDHHLALYNFDTYRLVQKLESDGFSPDSAEAIMASLSDVVSESVANVTRSGVTKAEFERAVYQNQVDFGHIRNEIQLIEKNEFTTVRADLKRLSSDLEKFRLHMIEELRGVQSSVRLDLSLEKGHLRDEQSSQEIRLHEEDSRVETEISGLRTQLESVKWELFRTLFPLFCAGGALAFSYLRFVK